MIAGAVPFFIGTAAIAAVADVKASVNQKDFLASIRNFTEPFDDQSMWEYGVESNDIDKKILTLAALSVIDFKQSADAGFKKGTGFSEKNPILGADPSISKLAAFGLAGVGTVYVAEKLFENHPGLQQVFIDSVLSTETYNIESNSRLVNIGYGKTAGAIPIIITVRW